MIRLVLKISRKNWDFLCNQLDAFNAIITIHLMMLSNKKKKKRRNFKLDYRIWIFFVILHNNNNWHYSLPLDAVKGGVINSITNESNNRVGVSRRGCSPTKWNTNPYRISRRGPHFFRCSPLLFIWLYRLYDYEGDGLRVSWKAFQFTERTDCVDNLYAIFMRGIFCCPAVLLTLPSPCARNHRSSAGWPHRAACHWWVCHLGRSSRQWWE